MPTNSASRLNRLRQALGTAGAASFLDTHLPNLYYLTGFSGDSGALLVDGSSTTLFTDGRFTIQAREETRGIRVHIHKGPLLQAVGEYLRARKRPAHKVAVSPSHLTLAGWKTLRKAAGGRLKWVAVDGLVETLRAVKDAAEIDRLRDAARLGSQVMEETIRLVRPGVAELDLAAEIVYRMRRKGASGESFEAIVAAGPRSALPHARPTARRIGKNELVVLDLGAILRGYCSDLTRTVYVGKAPARVRQWYQAVLEAETAARAAVRSGVTCGAVDAAARNVLQRKGLARYFTHSTGHGIGLEIHEDPRIARDQKKLLETGNVVTVEPGVYVEGVGGIRIEDDVLVTARGAEVLTTAPREFLEV
ncbi:MAG TPA: Xaa-Pro peptidase family protein [Verrucomicrobiae bacterium]|jgi:Xaa-Pro aminopeptidase|nr:Xaa-Pro peptidase family protein [Verrucomicrobiae bacterium]